MTTSYFDYPAGSDTQTTCAAPTATANRANCDFAAAGDLTNKGSYTGSASPYGTFDQGGNVYEWSEAIIGPFRGARGGRLSNGASFLAASARNQGTPDNEDNSFGFRVAMIPEPGTGLLVMTGLLGLACRRKRRT